MSANRVILTLGNKQVVEPEELFSLKIGVTFSDLTATPTIETGTFTFVRDAAKAITDHIKGGLSGGVGIFEGIAAKMTLYDQNQTQVIFDGYLDLTEDYEEIEPQFKGENPAQVRAKFVSESSLDNFETIIAGVSLPYLESLGVFSAADYVNLPFIIEAGFNPLEIATIIISIYTLEQAIEDTITRISELITLIIADIAGGAGGPIAGPIAAAAVIVVEIAIAIALIALVTKLVLDLINLILSPVRNHKVITLRKMITNSLAHFNYQINTNLSDLDNFYYLPSRAFSDSEGLASGIFPQPIEIKKAIPKQGDFGYLVSEVLQIITDVFNARVSITGDTVNIFNEADPFFKKKSGYVLPDILLPSKKYNTRDLPATRILTFITDTMDEWTIENRTGTAVEIKTDPIKVNNIKRVSIKGLEEVRIPLALATVKKELNNLEKILEILLSVANLFFKAFQGIKKLAKRFGKSGSVPDKDLQNIITRRIGMMKVSGPYHSIPKLVYMIGGKIPLNQREVLSAPALEEKYYRSKSFIDEQENAQRLVYDGVTNVPFTLADFKKVVGNEKFSTFEGKEAEFNSLEWEFMNDRADMSFEIKEKYTDNLTETKIIA